MEQHTDINRSDSVISVVVPVYNGEKYLNECIDSILAQSFKDIELLLIDDGSKDSSGKICDDYTIQDQRVRVIHKNNEGINATRRRGVFEAKGEWIAFVDNDDSLPEYALERLYALHENTDIVIGFPDVPNYNKNLSLEECRRNMITAKLLPPSPWGKLYKRKILTDDIFDFPREIDGEEDMIMNIRLLFKINRAPRICFHKVYNFRRNSASVSHTKKASLKHEQAFDMARSMSIPLEKRASYMKEIIWSRINGLTSIAYRTPNEITSWKHPYLQQLKSDIKKYNYHPNFQEWCILHIRFSYALKVCAFGIILKNFIRYRLGLNN
ncbi:glycosyltransferase family 2 protein [Prevotella sp. KH2C16]|uniref:glycosyltransferase family 2 protein n=1 Tax=Prevotella sp. KH2C16 TaxID=1855325 RepID=UPI0008F2A4C1|nr:glycosyltransferase family 2 protein [Prevotella sp. KH2C16]SFG53539.1 Glycosyltransferase involved in cell wall bisynthesis [Prevotella sp. KH2C16]